MIPVNAIAGAAVYDRTLQFTDAALPLIRKKYLPPVAYTKKLLFDSMCNGRTVVFNNYPLRYVVPSGKDKTTYTLDMLRTSLPAKEKIYIRYGPLRTLKRVSIKEVIERWSRGRSRFGVTDLHFRNTKYFKRADANSISYFNLLPYCREEVSFLEMLTLVISSKGIFSDSHSDDGDGSNHCIIGKKLWLAWDKEEGKQGGLQDCTYDPVYTQARFSMQKFLSLKSSHWFLVSEGETLFMPGNFTHKVVTLENYVGFGSFYVSFPNYINSIKRWVLRYASDAKGDFVKNLNRDCLQHIKKKVSKMTAQQRKNVGFDYFKKAAASWEKGLTPAAKNKLGAVAKTKELMQAAKEIRG